FGLGGRHIATITRSAIKETCCESCGGVYFYQLTRCVFVKLSTWDTLRAGVEGAWHLAMHRTQAMLTRMLERASDPVPCPACGRYQGYMLARARSIRFHGLLSYRIVVPLLAGVVSFVVAIVLTHASLRNLPSEGIDLWLLILVWAAGLLGLVIGTV